MALPAGAVVVRRVDRFRLAIRPKQMNPLGVGHQEPILRQRIRIAIESRTDASGPGHVIRAATGLGSRVRLVANDFDAYASYGLEIVPDRWPDCGALGGMGEYRYGRRRAASS